MSTTDYQQQAIDFLNKYNVKFSAKFLKYGKHWDDDNYNRNVYTCSLSRNGKKISFTFGQSVDKTEKEIAPTPYDLLTCIEKYEPEDFDWWTKELGYSDRPLSEYPKVKKIYNSVVKEWQKVESFFSPEELEELREIN